MATILARRSTDHRLFLALALLLAIYAGVGFWPSYIGAGFLLAPLPSVLVHVHAVLFVGWIVLFAGQVGLIASRHVATHRRLGAAMGWWAAAMVVIGPAVTIMAVRRPDSGVDAAILAGDLATAIVFAMLIGVGLARRRDAAAHKRLMMLASAAIIGPALARWPFAAFHTGPPIAITVLYLLPPVVLAAYDLVQRRHIHWATWLGFALMLAILAAFIGSAASPGWQVVTRWVQQV